MNWNDIKTIAIIGASQKPSRASNEVMRYFLSKGFDAIPVNPKYKTVLGKECFPSLPSIPEKIARKIDMVDVFIRSDAVIPIAKDAAEIKKRYGNLKVFWMQLNVINKDAAEIAENSGLEVISNACAMISHKSRTIP